MVKISILQLTFNDENRYYCYNSLKSLKRHNLKVDLNRYDVAYVTERPDIIDDVYSYLDDLFEEFNIKHPEDFRGHSLSVSDIVKLDDTYYFCDSFGWEKLDF